MKLLNLIKYTYLNTIIYFILIHHADSLSVLQPLNREIRFTKFDVKIFNRNTGTILESTFRQYGSKQKLFLHFMVHEKIKEINVKFSVFKCKEYYIDCINVVSYDIFNACSKLILLTHFNLMENSEKIVKKCPIYGEYEYSNMTIDANKFMSSFSNPTEKWWQHYWITKVFISNDNSEVISNATVDFYFIQFRRRNHKL